MEIDENEIIQQDETEWIARSKHDLILRKYRLNTQRLIKEYQTKIQQKNRQIEQLVKEVKRQQFVIDTLSNNEMSALPQTSIENEKNGKVSDSEMETIIYADVESQPTKAKYAKENGSNLRTIIKPRVTYTKSSRNRAINQTEIVRKKPSLVSIQIQPHIRPNIPPLTNFYICDQCNKKMSSRRVLAVG